MNNPLRNPAAEFEHLLNQRDLAAYRVVAVVKVVLDFFEGQDFASAEAQLRRIRKEYDEADAKLNHFRAALKLNSKGETRHGNSSAIA